MLEQGPHSSEIVPCAYPRHSHARIQSYGETLISSQQPGWAADLIHQGSTRRNETQVGCRQGKHDRFCFSLSMRMSDRLSPVVPMNTSKAHLHSFFSPTTKSMPWSDSHPFLPPHSRSFSFLFPRPPCPLSPSPSTKAQAARYPLWIWTVMISTWRPNSPKTAPSV